MSLPPSSTSTALSPAILWVFFYVLFNYLTDQKLSHQVANFGVYSRKVIEAVKSFARDGETTSATVAQIFGVAHLSMLGGFVFLSHQIGGFLGVWLGGMMYDLTGGYSVVWWIGVGVGAFSAVLHLPIRGAGAARRARHRARAGYGPRDLRIQTHPPRGRAGRVANGQLCGSGRSETS